MSLNSHCFNIEDIRPDTCVNLINEIVLAIVRQTIQEEHISRTSSTIEPQMAEQRTKRKANSEKTPNITIHNINSIRMSDFSDTSTMRGRDTSTRRSKAIEEEDLQEKTNR